MTFPAEGVTLEEAVRLTLQYDPGVQRAEANTRFRAGVTEEQSGAFDFVLSGSAAYRHRFQELTQTAKEEQQSKRTELQGVADAGPDRIEQARQARDLLARIQSGEASPDELTEVSPTLAASLIMLDELIRTAPENVVSQLEETRAQVLADSLRLADAELSVQQQILDAAQEELTNIGPAPVDEYFRNAELSVQLSKPFRSGWLLAPFFDGTYDATGFRGKPHQIEFGGKGLTDLYQFRAGLSVLVPLARGRGAAAVAAPERAARIEQDASLRGVEHERASAVLTTVLAYWDVRASQDAAAVAARSLEFQQQLVELIRKLVASGDLAGIELSRAQAAEATARADVDDAARRLRDARVALAIAMGIGAGADDASLPLARDAFPRPPAVRTAAPALIDQALAGRQDLAAAAGIANAGDVLATGARHDQRPLLDVSAATWYVALDEGSGRKALDRWVGPSASLGIQFEKPFGNNLARGYYEQRRADAELRAIDQADLARQIQLRVVQAASTVEQALTRVTEARAAVTFYQATVDAELARLQSGDSTVLDAIVTQQQQIGAQLALVAAELELARRLVELRFETATLVVDGAVRAADLVTVPGGGGL